MKYESKLLTDYLKLISRKKELESEIVESERRKAYKKIESPTRMRLAYWLFLLIGSGAYLIFMFLNKIEILRSVGADEWLNRFSVMDENLIKWKHFIETTGYIDMPLNSWLNLTIAWISIVFCISIVIYRSVNKTNEIINRDENVFQIIASGLFFILSGLYLITMLLTNNDSIFFGVDILALALNTEENEGFLFLVSFNKYLIYIAGIFSLSMIGVYSSYSNYKEIKKSNKVIEKTNNKLKLEEIESLMKDLENKILNSQEAMTEIIEKEKDFLWDEDSQYFHELKSTFFSMAKKTNKELIDEYFNKKVIINE